MTQTDGSTYHLLSDYCMDFAPKFTGQLEMQEEATKQIPVVSVYLIERKKELVSSMFFWAEFEYYCTQVFIWVGFVGVIILLSILEIAYEHRDPELVLMLFVILCYAAFFLAFTASIGLFKKNPIIRRKKAYYRHG